MEQADGQWREHANEPHIWTGKTAQRGGGGYVC